MSPTDDADRPTTGVADRATGEIRILEANCSHCLLNPIATAIHLPPGRLKEFVREAQEAETHVVCHSTTPPFVPEGYPEAMCRGYIDAYGLPAVVRLALSAGARLVEVPDPAANRYVPNASPAQEKTP
ncbi:hypothetical protein ACIQCG_01055 [Streptomyces noursei]|uniref:hypothetical protein n=1 Tax=Streptomyces noursei TaxID=1971 RepID=UPI0038301D1E